MIQILELIEDNFLVIALSIGTVFTFWWLCQFREKLRLGTLVAAVLAVLHTVIGVISVSAFAVLETLDLSSLGNMSLFGGVFFMPIAYYVGARLTKRSYADVFDIFVVPLVFTVLCARCNCIVAGCCKGAVIPGTGNLRWPTRELEIVFYVCLLAYLIPRVKRGEMGGKAYPLYMAAYGIFRFIIEWFRESTTAAGILHMGHIWAVISLCLGVSIYYSLQEASKKESKNRARRR